MSPAVPAGLEGPSFPPFLKLLATALVIALAAAALDSAESFVSRPPGAAASGFLLAVTAVIGAGYWAIVSGRTSIDAESICQTGLWTRRVQIADITQVKLIHVPGLTWLIVPRLVVRSRGLGMTTFATADGRVLAEFRRLAYGEAAG